MDEDALLLQSPQRYGGAITMWLVDVDNVKRLSLQPLLHLLLVCARQLKQIMKVAMFDPMRKVVSPNSLYFMAQLAQCFDSLILSASRAGIRDRRYVRH